MICRGYRGITAVTKGATTLGVNPPSSPVLEVVVLPVRVSSFTKPFPHSSTGKESARNAGDPGSMPGSGGSPGEGKVYPLQCSSLENSTGYIHEVAKSWTRLSLFHFHFPLELFNYLLNYLKNYISQNWLPPASFQVLHKSFST